MDFKRSHFINVFESTSRYLVLLVFPVFRALFFSDFDLYIWIRGAWFDIIVIMAIIGLGLISWYKYSYYLSEHGILVKKGIFFVKRRFIAYNDLSIVSIEKPFYLFPFRAVRIKADTDGGSPKKSDFAITIYSGNLDEICSKVTAPFINRQDIKRVYLPKSLYIAILSFVVSNSITGVLFIATFVSGMGKVLGSEVESQFVDNLTKITEILAFGVPPAAAIIAITILGGWGVSFFLNLIRHLRFSVTRQSKHLRIQTGLVTHREYLITTTRINLIELRQTLITKLCGLYIALIHCNGYGKNKDELSVLMPACVKSDLRKNMHLLLPEIPFCKPTIKPKLRYLSRFIIPPLTWIGSVLAVWLVAWWFFPGFRELSLFIVVMAEIPCVWFLFVKILSFFHTGVGFRNGVYTFSLTYGFRFKTIAIPQKRIVKLTLRQSLLQINSGCCDIVVLSHSEGKKRHVVLNVNFAQAKEMFEVD